MSTKITISYGPKFHLWEECFDRSNVYLKFEENQYSILKNNVTLQIPIEVWRAMLEDWSKRGWPKEEDGKELEISNNWLNSLEITLDSINKNV